MEQLKIYIWYEWLLEFKNNVKATEISYKI